MRILITGANGLLGRTFMKNFPNNEYIVYPGRIENQSELSNFINLQRSVDWVLHFAALVPRSIVENQTSQAFDINVMGTYNLLEALRKIYGSRIKVLVVSTSHVYTSQLKRLTENDETNPVSWYGKTKLISESICQIFRNNHELNICNPRVFSYTSKLQSDDFFIPAMIKRIYKAPLYSKLNISGLNGTRDFLTVDQVVFSLELLLQENLNSPVNIGTGYKTQLIDIVRLIQSELNRFDLNVTTDDSEIHLVSDTSLLESLGIKNESRIKEYVKEMVADFKSNNT